MGRRVLVAVLVLLFVVPAPAVQAQDGTVRLVDGTWLGNMGAGGVLTGNVEGVSATWVGWIDGSFSFDVAGGSSSGDWDWYGAADINAMTPEGPMDITLQSSAGGPLSGSTSSFTLAGQQSTTGQGSFMGMTTHVGPIPNPVDPIDVVFLDASCNVAFADWTTSLEELAAEGGFTGSLNGFFVATNIAPAGDPEEAAELVAAYDELYDRASGAISSISGGFSTSALLDYLDLVEEAAALEAEAELLSNTCAFDQVDGGPFATSLTSLLASVLRSSIHVLDPHELLNAVQILLATGAIGNGASPVTADLIEPLLAEQAQALLDQGVITSGAPHRDGRPCSPVEPCIIVDRGLLQVFVAADMMGIQLTTGGVPMDYATLRVAQR